MSAMCAKCGKKPVREAGYMCKACAFQDRVAYEHTMPADDQDWEFAICECCGSSLGNNAECPNTSCGCSPHVGEDWI